MKLNLPCPKNWEDFEDLCFHLWKLLWGDPRAHRYGRQGQQQNGVDIYGQAIYDDQLTGVQCKGRNKNYGKELTVKEIDRECKEAKKFRPKLGTFILATTSPRNTRIQDHCLSLNKRKKYDFKVDAWSWDDIEDEIQSRPEIMENFYPALKDKAELLNQITLSRFVSLNKIHAFLSRPHLIPFNDKYAKTHLLHITWELAMNAFHHGHARQFSIQINGSKITFKDDGNIFDPCCLLNNEGPSNGGSTALRYAKKYFNFNYYYDEEDNVNVFEVYYIEELDNSNNNQPCTLMLKLEDLCTRDQITRYVSEEIENQCTNSTKIIVDIVDNGFVMPSINFSIVDALAESLKEYQSVIVYLPNSLYYEVELRQRTNSSQIKFMKKGWYDLFE